MNFPIPSELTLIKYGVYAILVAIFLGAVYYAKYEHDTLITYQASVAQAGRDQEALTKQKDKENDQTKLYIAQSYSDELARLQRYTHRSQLPKASSGAQSFDGTQQELSGACKGTEFYSNALEDALKLQTWQEWAIRHNLPVEN